MTFPITFEAFSTDSKFKPLKKWRVLPNSKYLRKGVEQINSNQSYISIIPFIHVIT